ncbi:hypothetical protein [Nostoc sp.]|uniref:hypothetical protein n=1 Tax=Nostoc sp. TaxID=1180 RepID=UPI002FF65F28
MPLYSTVHRFDLVKLSDRIAPVKAQPVMFDSTKVEQSNYGWSKLKITIINSFRL